MGLFQKKQKNTEPPLPDNLPPLEMPPDTMINNPTNTHDQIPNDIALNQPFASDMQAFTENIPNNSFPTHPGLMSTEKSRKIQRINDRPSFDAPSPDAFSSNIPSYAETKSSDELPALPQISQSDVNLPELPEMPEANSSRMQEPAAEEPMPMLDEAVPTPPPIFSDETFYETPDEIKHLVEERKSKREPKKEARTYDSYTETSKDEGGFAEEAPGKKSIDGDNNQEERKHEGPIFVNINAFRNMLGDVETIKNKIKSSELIMEHLKEIKESKDSELERWRSQIEDIQKKINYIDKLLFNEV